MLNNTIQLIQYKLLEYIHKIKKTTIGMTDTNFRTMVIGDARREM